jgi:multicomponent Na+:H+ antiporter subunit G
MTIRDAVTVLLLVAGALFFVAGTVGLLRFPDVYTRLHALTKADNLGLGLISLGLAIQSTALVDTMKLAMIWMLVLVSSSISCQLIARAARQSGVTPWKP